MNEGSLWYKMMPAAMLLFFNFGLIVWAVSSADFAHRGVLATNQLTNRLVFAHFMVCSEQGRHPINMNNPLTLTYQQIGSTSNRQNTSDYDEDMRRAKSLGIDAFALDIGVDTYTNHQLDMAYESAAQNAMKVFISFDFNWWKTDQAVKIGEMIAHFATRPAQLIVDNKVFASTFAGDGLDVPALRAAAGIPIFFAPNFHPGLGADVSSVDGLFNWMAWPNNGRNKAPTPHSNVSVGDGDRVYINALAGRPYIARE